jgi:hypothetical protein
MGKWSEAVKRTGGAGDFMKLQQGNNRIRVLGDPVAENKTFPNNPEPQTIFSWAVWDYSTNSIKILSKSGSFLRNFDSIMDIWGDDVPMQCDITIIREGSGQKDTRYKFVPSPIKTQLPENWQDDMPDLLTVIKGSIDISSYSQGIVPETQLLEGGEAFDGSDPFEGMDVR